MITFSYTKITGEKTARTGIVISKPNKNWSILDISGLSKEEQKEFEEAYYDYEEKRKALFKSFNLDKYFKHFKEEGISEVKCIE